MKIRNFKSFVLICFLSLFAFSCGGGGGSSSSNSNSNNNTGTGGTVSSSNVSLSGRIGSGYTVAYRPSTFDRMFAFLVNRASAAGEDVDAIWAMPTVDNEIGTESFDHIKKVSINPDGTFTLTLRKYVTLEEEGNVTVRLNWLLLLVNSNAADKKDMIVGYVALSDVEDSLLWLPLSNASASINLGNINKSGDEARSSLDLSNASGPLNLSLDALRAIAKSDDILKNIKNVFLNYDEQTGKYWDIEPYFNFHSNNTESIKNGWADVDNLTFGGYAFYVSTNNIENPTFNEVCGGTKRLKLYPPEGTTVSLFDNSESFNSTHPISTQNATVEEREDGTEECSSGNFYLRNDGDSYMYNFIVGDSNLLRPPIPEGYWNIKLWDGQSETVVATFDAKLVASGLFYPGTTKPKVFMPSIYVSVDGNNNITSIKIRFYQYDNGTDKWVEVTNATIIKETLANIGVSIDDYNGTTANGGRRVEDNLDVDLDGVSSLPIVVNATQHYSWKFIGDNADDVPVADSIAVSYFMGDVDFRFVWRK